jgi:hypothetical protein
VLLTTEPLAVLPNHRFANNKAPLGGKWLELLSEVAPGLKRTAIMFNPDTALVSTYMPSLETAARSFKVEPIMAPVHGDAEIEAAINALGREPGGGLVVRGCVIAPLQAAGAVRSSYEPFGAATDTLVAKVLFVSRVSRCFG